MEANRNEDQNEKKDSANGKEKYEPPHGANSEHSLNTEGGELKYRASADWLVLRRRDKPRAEMFHISYIALKEGQADDDRPVTFVFNGGPGASSVYLHLGAMGPRRADFRDNGQPLDPPHRLVENSDSWLAFTDLVFIDPIGTGFSRMIEDEKEAKDGKSAEGEEKEKSEYWQIKRDLESLGEFISSWLSRNHRWESPLYIAGESYGGFRSAKLTRMLQQDYGVGLNGAIIISPALEFTLLDGSDYDVLMWLDSFPTMAAAAWFHKRAKQRREGEDLRAYLARTAEFAVKELLPVLAAGDMYGSEAKNRVLGRAADYIGLPRDIVRAKNGRVTIDWFVKNLLRDQGRHLGLYDASLAVEDPYPDRDGYSGPDPTLHHVERVFAAGINTQLRKHIGLETERDYFLISETVNREWKVDTRNHALESQVGATDDLRYGMTLNPSMKVYLTHGVFDLVTPYFAADRISNLMKLTDEQKSRIIVKHYDGGHMFYGWKASRRALFEDMKAFYANR